MERASARPLDGVIEQKSTTIIQKDSTSQLDDTDDLPRRLPGLFNFIPQHGVLGVLSFPLVAFLRMMISIQVFLLSMWLFLRHRAMALAVWIVNGPITGRLLAYVVPYNTWKTLLRLFGRRSETPEEKFSNSHLDKTINDGREYLHHVRENVLEGAKMGLDKLKDTGNVVRDRLKHRVGEAAAQLDNIRTTGGAALGKFNNTVTEVAHDSWEQTRDAGKVFGNGVHENVSETYSSIHAAGDTLRSDIHESLPENVTEILDKVQHSTDAILGDLHKRMADRKNMFKEGLLDI